MTPGRVFYPLGGGQAGDAGELRLADGRTIAIVDTRKAKDAEGRPTADIVHLPAPGQATLLASLKPGDTVTAQIHWAWRHRLMRFHTTTHLLCHLVPVPVNGCSITPDCARLDLHLTEPLDKEALTTTEIGRVVVIRIEKKSATTRRAVLGLAD